MRDVVYTKDPVVGGRKKIPLIRKQDIAPGGGAIRAAA